MFVLIVLGLALAMAAGFDEDSDSTLALMPVLLRLRWANRPVEIVIASAIAMVVISLYVASALLRLGTFAVGASSILTASAADRLSEALTGAPRKEVSA